MKTRIIKTLTNFKAATTAVIGITAALIFAAAPVQSGQPKVDMCHKDTVISVAFPVVAAHLRHDDTFALGLELDGECLDIAPI